jgi:hypothetical protein
MATQSTRVYTDFVSMVTHNRVINNNQHNNDDEKGHWIASMIILYLDVLQKLTWLLQN